jgi:hypothetical protein
MDSRVGRTRHSVEVEWARPQVGAAYTQEMVPAPSRRGELKLSDDTPLGWVVLVSELEQETALEPALVCARIQVHLPLCVTKYRERTTVLCGQPAGHPTLIYRFAVEQQPR